MRTGTRTFGGGHRSGPKIRRDGSQLHRPALASGIAPILGTGRRQNSDSAMELSAIAKPVRAAGDAQPAPRFVGSIAVLWTA